MKKTIQKHLLIFTLFACASSYVLAPIEEAESADVTKAKEELKSARDARDLAEQKASKRKIDEEKLQKELSTMQKISNEERKVRIQDSQDRINKARNDVKTAQEILNDKFIAAKDAMAKDKAAKKEGLKKASQNADTTNNALVFLPEAQKETNITDETDNVETDLAKSTEKTLADAIKKRNTENKRLYNEILYADTALKNIDKSVWVKDLMRKEGKTKDEAIEIIMAAKEASEAKLNANIKAIDDARANLNTAKQTPENLKNDGLTDGQTESAGKKDSGLSFWARLKARFSKPSDNDNDTEMVTLNNNR